MEEEPTSFEASASLFDDREFEVADILINFENLILKSEYFMQLPPAWGARRRRSGLRTSSQSSLPSPMTTSAANKIEAKKSGEVNAVAPSPKSPLLYHLSASSESDDKSNHSLSRNSKKRAREDLMEKVRGLSNSRDLLREEVERVRTHYNRLLTFNAGMRSLRQQVISSRGCQYGADTQLGKPGSGNSGPDLSSSNPIAFPHHQMLLVHPPDASDSQAREPFQFIHSQVSQPLISSNLGNGVGWVTPDLNISVGVGPAQAWDFFLAKRAKYAEARMNRRNKRAYAKGKVELRPY